jgi:molecular chaperone GrpE
MGVLRPDGALMRKKKHKKNAEEAPKDSEAKVKTSEEQITTEEKDKQKELLKAFKKEMDRLGPEGLRELKEKASERDKFLDMLQRTRADYLNYQKRALREMDALKTVILCEFIRELLPVLDDFERAIESAETSRDFESLQEGVKLIDNKFRDILKRHDVEPIEVVGEVFDPHLHEALLVEETDEYEDKTVIGEVQKGYKMPGQVLRPSRVKVAKRKERPEPKEEKGPPEGQASDTGGEPDKELPADGEGKDGGEEDKGANNHADV